MTRQLFRFVAPFAEKSGEMNSVFLLPAEYRSIHFSCNKNVYALSKHLFGNEVPEVLCQFRKRQNYINKRCLICYIDNSPLNL